MRAGIDTRKKWVYDRSLEMNLEIYDAEHDDLFTFWRVQPSLCPPKGQKDRIH